MTICNVSLTFPICHPTQLLVILSASAVLAPSPFQHPIGGGTLLYLASWEAKYDKKGCDIHAKQ
jgi:hypothetical protein